MKIPQLPFIFFFLLAGCVFGEPEKPGQTPAQDSPGKPDEKPKWELKQLAPGILGIGEIVLDTKKYLIHFPAVVNQVENLIEYAVVHNDGKTHESLLRTTISPYQLQVLLLLAKAQKFKESLPEFDATGREAPPAIPRPKHRIQILVQDLRDKKNPMVPLGNWILNVDDGKPMQEKPWMYTGSVISQEGQFVAEMDGDIVAVYLNPVAIFNSWIPGSNNDESWIPHRERVPPLGTPVRVILKFPK